jgi:hypothetical protein
MIFIKWKDARAGAAAARARTEKPAILERMHASGRTPVGGSDGEFPESYVRPRSRSGLKDFLRKI